jgi:hypothetical protein
VPPQVLAPPLEAGPPIRRAPLASKTGRRAGGTGTHRSIAGDCRCRSLAPRRVPFRQTPRCWTARVTWRTSYNQHRMARTTSCGTAGTRCPARISQCRDSGGRQRCTTTSGRLARYHAVRGAAAFVRSRTTGGFVRRHARLRLPFVLATPTHQPRQPRRHDSTACWRSGRGPATE